MRSRILVVALAFLLIGFNVVNAQNRIGVLGGVNIANFDVKDAEEIDNLTGLGIGGLIEFSAGDMLKICFEPMYLQKGAQAEATEENITVKGELNLAYLEIPALVKIPIGSGPYLMAGPTIGILLSSKAKVSAMGLDMEIDTKEQMESIDYGVCFGGGLNIPLGNNSLFFEARYTLGLANIVKEGEVDIDGQTQVIEDTEVKNKGIQIMAGLSIPLGK